jgi:hypothetical protein
MHAAPTADGNQKASALISPQLCPEEARVDETKPADERTVVRTWKRDGTTNRMGLTAAVEHLARAPGVAESDLEARRQSVRQELLDGRTLETGRATFVIAAAERTESA